MMILEENNPITNPITVSQDLTFENMNGEKESDGTEPEAYRRGKMTSRQRKFKKFSLNFIALRTMKAIKIICRKRVQEISNSNSNSSTLKNTLSGDSSCNGNESSNEIQTIERLFNLLDGGDGTKRFPDDFSPLHEACRHGYSPETIEWIITERPHLVRATDTRRRTPLHYITDCFCYGRISYHNCVSIIEKLCDIEPANIHITDDEGNAPMDIAEMAVISASRANDTGRPEKLQNLRKLAKCLRKISVEVYRNNKRHYETVGFSTFEALHSVSEIDNVSTITLAGNSHAYSIRLSDASQTISLSTCSY